MNIYADDLTLTDLGTAYEYYNHVSSVSSTDTMQSSRPVGGTGLGGVAGNLMEPIGVVASFLSGMSIIIGMTCLFGAFVRYMQHRVNPLAHPISIVITLLVLGILLLLLPLIYKLTETGIPSSLG